DNDGAKDAGQPATLFCKTGRRLITKSQDQTTEVITSSAIAPNVVGVLVGGIGVALAIPFTTAVAAVVAAQARPVGVPAPRPADEQVPQPDPQAPAALARTPTDDED